MSLAMWFVLFRVLLTDQRKTTARVDHQTLEIITIRLICVHKLIVDLSLSNLHFGISHLWPLWRFFSLCAAVRGIPCCRRPSSLVLFFSMRPLVIVKTTFSDSSGSPSNHKLNNFARHFLCVYNRMNSHNISVLPSATSNLVFNHLPCVHKLIMLRSCS